MALEADSFVVSFIHDVNSYLIGASVHSVPYSLF